MKKYENNINEDYFINYIINLHKLFVKERI